MLDTNAAQDDIAAGRAALQTAAWAEAGAAFERALGAAESPEAHDGLGVALWWLNDIEAAHRHRALAYKGFKERGETGRAARIACWLAREQIFLSGNFPAMQGWFVRAEQLLDRQSPGLEEAWFAVMRASVAATPEEMIPTAEQAVAAARRFADNDLEAFALAFYGQALATLGRVGEGMSRLDEAMTMAMGGEVADLTTISEIFCVMLSTCETAGDLARSDLWCRTAMAFAQRYSCPFLSAYCRTAYGGLMSALGRWQEAETALLEAVRAFEQGHKGLRVHAVIKLADLRVSQGKIEEAETMLDGMEDQSAAVVPLARLALQKGDATQARAVLEQALPEAPPYTLHHLPALLLMAEVLLALDDLPGARQVMARLTAMAGQANSRLLTAQVELAQGRLNLHAGDFVAAKAGFNAALGHLQSYEQSLLAGQVRLRMAQALMTDDPAGAAAWAKGALATFERIGAEQYGAQAADLLRRLGVSRRSGSRGLTLLTAREMEVASLIAQGMTNRDIAERLVISPKTVEHHVSRILDKLGLHSRVEIAAYAASGKLAK